jgi:hypothetical protein
MLMVFSILRKWYWKMIRFIGVYQWYVIIDCFAKVVGCYLIQRKKKSGHPVVIIDHNFIQDIEALNVSSGSAGINLIRIPFESFYLLAGCYFSEEIRDGSYLTEEMRLPKERYNAILRFLFSIWHPQKFIKGFVCPSDSFFWIREIIVLLREIDIPCVVVDKEGTISPHSMENHSRQITERYPFMSDWILVWSERQRKFWKRTGVDGSRILVTGQPRSDFFFNKNFWLPKKQFLSGCKRMVLFFTFETDAYAPVPGDHIWRELRNDIHSSLLSLAAAYPDVSFIVKTHPQQIDRFEVEKEFIVHELDNISVLHGPELARHLIVHADVVVGFQTTGLIEAMLAGKRVVYTEWSDEVCANLHHLIPFHEAQGIDIARSRREFEDIMDSMLRSRSFDTPRECTQARKPFVDIYIPNADGKASIRVLQHLVDIIDCSYRTER